MKWSEAYATGIERVDEHHRMLFRMVEDYRAALDEGAGERVFPDLLRSLDTYARLHFKFEEECMDRYHCPVAGKNKEAHAKFIEVVAGFRQRYDAIGFDRADGWMLVDGLDAWLDDHICRIDTQLKPYVGRD